MALSIKTAEADKLARSLAQLTGESMTEATADLLTRMSALSRRLSVAKYDGGGSQPPVSWPGLDRPPTTFLRFYKDVGGRPKAGHDTGESRHQQRLVLLCFLGQWFGRAYNIIRP
jgi:hypothetical protein